jgi:glycyl-tRNA synthetase beta chain
MSLPFLLEIGTEEIPDWMIERSVHQLKEFIEGLFLRENLLYGQLRPDATPRRLVLRAWDVQAQQDAQHKTIRGPSEALARSGDDYTPAARAFLARNNAEEKEICIETTSKGNYLAIRREIPGRYTVEILAEALPSLILQIHFPKTMYWTGKTGPRFIRPIRWIVALLGHDVIPFELAGVRSGNVTSGHRRLGSARIPITIETYEQTLRDNFVILSYAERHRMISEGIAQLGIERRPDYLELQQTLAHLTEFPTPIVGDFDSQFLELPDEVLTTVMRHHQRYFSVQGRNGELLPKFVAVMNINADPEGLIRRGNERVLRARFNDARFFWQTDLRKMLADRVEDLAHVTFHAQLGSYLDKTNRVEDLVRQLGGDKHAQRAARLAKCDLTTELVKEFTELQGVVGSLYARAQGEPEEVCQGIREHYKPESMADYTPRSVAGRLVSIADKLDTLRECFRIGMAPTGSRDPFALRRAAQGVVKVVVEGHVEIRLADLINSVPGLRDFFEDRVKFYFREEKNYAYDEVNAAMAAGWDDLLDLQVRLHRLQKIRPTPDFEPLAASFKRIKNILRQAEFTGGPFTPALLDPGPESDLFDEINRSAGQPIETVIGALRPKVDLFFDKVLVNAPDPAVRANRLAMLHNLLKHFQTFADFSEIVTNS